MARFMGFSFRCEGGAILATHPFLDGLTARWRRAGRRAGVATVYEYDSAGKMTTMTVGGIPTRLA